MTEVTRGLGQFVSRLRFEEIPALALEAANIGMLDCIGTMLAGAGEPAPKLVAATVAAATGNNFATEAVTGGRLSAADAALVNGTAAHVLDYDDVALSGHPSAALTPAILAVGQTEGASGREALAAYAAGYEVWAQLQALETGQLHDRGFHPTAVMGTIAAAAAASRLYRLDAEQTTHALALAASLASGLVSNFGSMTKSLHVGRAAQSGIMSARLARDGFTASPDTIEHRSGFLKAHSPSGAPLLHQPLDAGRPWRLERNGVNIKRYPTCYATHRSIDAMLGLVEDRALTPDQVALIQVRTGSTQHGMLRNARPRTGLEAKFSMEFAMASALVARMVGLDQLTDAFVQRADVQSQFEKVSITTTDERMAGDETFAPFDQVAVTTVTGDTVSSPPVSHARGSWQRPLSDAELMEKFTACVTLALGADAAPRLWAQLRDLTTLASLRDLDLSTAPALKRDTA
ncbi:MULTISPECIES: MmgE/PrpD family protein [unclassified Chelatococcus]|uniref:MmgE/PrpD family protein n=1 Tax=unclassified Chelatococcus TaxID=2638111 RepID=UPI001BCDBA1D|nr:MULTISPECIES: MmgE/PrpD family protein [unclassified Chelatococcus]MBS7701355.1 MmgE/PrpD family protein [Chelatococcus sp. YT9]MBX3557435.1 MmgE/PrpD family protein [Chelatococcus sp.]